LSERFGITVVSKIVFYLAAAAISIGYYFLILPESDITVSIGVKTAVAIFALFISFLWIASIKGKADFNAVFMSVFKAVFTAALMSIFYNIFDFVCNFNRHLLYHIFF